MRIAQNWKEYKIIDTTSQEKLESWNGNILIRPDPQIIWKTPKKSPLWDKMCIRDSLNRFGKKWQK